MASLKILNSEYDSLRAIVEQKGKCFGLICDFCYFRISLKCVLNEGGQKIRFAKAKEIILANKVNMVLEELR